MALFSRHTDEGRQRVIRAEYHQDPKHFRDLWAQGKISFMEIYQDTNMTSEYLRYFYLYEGKYHQLSPVQLEDSVEDTPFVELQERKVEESTYQHKGVTIKCKRVEDYVYHFTLERT